MHKFKKYKEKKYTKKNHTMSTSFSIILTMEKNQTFKVGFRLGNYEGFCKPA